jgi:serine/threonine protein kinase/formylglycine-generating enzyme required for sulfatase activity
VPSTDLNSPPQPNARRAYAELWSETAEPPDLAAFVRSVPSPDPAVIYQLVREDQLQRCRRNQPKPVEHYFSEFPQLKADRKLRFSLIVNEYEHLQSVRQDTQVEEYVTRFPDIQDELKHALSPSPEPPTIEKARKELDWKLQTQASRPYAPPDPTPNRTTFAHSPGLDRTHVGGYPVSRVIGRGGFGQVYLGRDETLQRDVAIKIWTRRRTRKDDDGSLREARLLARLDHPGIVPVYHVDEMEDKSSYYIVSKYVDGRTLREMAKHSRPNPQQAVEIIVKLAEAAHYAHEQGIIHHDLKPSNVLIDQQGQPHLIDFGVAFDVAKKLGPGCIAGTPAYMSPEQIRGEGHLIDRRSDIYSLGVMLYELLADVRPFPGECLEQMLEDIETLSPIPLRQFNRSVPREIERTCLRALSKRIRERHATALAFADELREFFDPADPSTVRQPRVIPRGLRSFGEEDAHFFLELLPGARDREGIPDVISTWRARIEESDPEKSFRVGLIYGPSGCGKSSLIKAGLLPHLDADTEVVYAEATPDDTEHRLLVAIRRRFELVSDDTRLPDMISSIRRGDLLQSNKLLIVIDQFEQWLHAHEHDAGSELLHALRQCDGETVQVLLLVRDDFWLAASRLMAELEIDLEQSKNIGFVDLFTVMHARNVLEYFGRAYDCLPAFPKQLNDLQNEFLNKAVEQLQVGGYVVPVRLAVFADMLKNREWSPENLADIGGAEGVGVAFLDEMLRGPKAAPALRAHPALVAKILVALLPEAGSEIKGSRKSLAELKQRTTFTGRDDDFETLLKKLDSETKLVTPVELAEVTDDDNAPQPKESREKFYQLTHDYLVPAIRSWSDQKKQGSLRGRAELQLAESTRFWKAHPNQQGLPAPFIWIKLAALTSARRRTKPQNEMMQRAFRRHSVRGFVMLLLLSLTSLGLWNANLNNTVAEFSNTVVMGELQQMEELRPRMNSLGRPAREALSLAFANPETSQHQKIKIALLLVEHQPEHIGFLVEQALLATPRNLKAFRAALKYQTNDAARALWSVALSDSGSDTTVRLCAAALLATLDPASPKWADVYADLTDWLTSQPEFVVADWAELLMPLRTHVTKNLRARMTKPMSLEQGNAAVSLATFYADEPPVLAELLAEAPSRFVPVFTESMRWNRSQSVQMLKNLISEADISDPSTGISTANCGIALALLGSEKSAARLLRSIPEPYVRGAIINGLAIIKTTRYGLDELFAWLGTEPDDGVQIALLSAIGMHPKYPGHELPSAQLELLQKTFGSDSPGVHATTLWVLKQNSRHDLITDWTNSLRRTPGTGVSYFHSDFAGTLTVIPGPSTFTMGPSSEDSTDPHRPHACKIPRTFAIAQQTVSLAEVDRFKLTNELQGPDLREPEWGPDVPARLTLVDAMRYCRWISELEDIPEDEMCYPPHTPIDDNYGPKANYLSKTGYRLPTEAEWEYASRAATITPHFCGLSAFATNYSICHESYTTGLQPVASRIPNDWGLFDTLGSVGEFCQDSWVNSQSNSVDLGEFKFNSETGSITRKSPGGGTEAAVLDSGFRSKVDINNINSSGIRVVKTIRTH